MRTCLFLFILRYNHHDILHYTLYKLRSVAKMSPEWIHALNSAIVLLYMKYVWNIILKKKNTTKCTVCRHEKDGRQFGALYSVYLTYWNDKCVRWLHLLDTESSPMNYLFFSDDIFVGREMKNYAKNLLLLCFLFA